MNEPMRIVFVVLLTVSLCSGFGGFGATGSFVDFEGLNQRFTKLNRDQPPEGWGGKDSFCMRAPLLWIGGHGGGFVDDMTVGGHGAVTVFTARVDSLSAEFAGLAGFFELGYRYAPVDFLWARPCLGIGGRTWVHYIHSHNSFSDPNFNRWFLAWNAGVLPGIELLGVMPNWRNNYVGLFVKASYFLPVLGPEWSLDADPPDFNLKGFDLHFGIRFGRLPSRTIRI